MNTATDFTITFGDFNSTEAELVAVSERGKARLAEALGAGAISCKLPKSEADGAERKLSGEGYGVTVWYPLS